MGKKINIELKFAEGSDQTDLRGSKLSSVFVVAQTKKKTHIECDVTSSSFAFYFNGLSNFTPLFTLHIQFLVVDWLFSA